MASALLAPGILARQRRSEVRGQIEAVLAERSFAPVFQPVVDLATGEPAGFEALTRFADGIRPDRRFADADAVGLGLELEVACLEAAVRASAALPPGAFLSLNTSPELLLQGDRLRACLRAATRRRF
ncbi:MAG: EAL domain-containing protein [Acidimicrobiia bacterium]|nr:EAL domain-containing protein [Acidimicrobiia bacterium]